MEGAYLPGNVRQRIQELMKEHKITQAQLATRIGSTESAISRFVSGKTDKISTEQLLGGMESNLLVPHTRTWSLPQFSC